MNPNSFLSLFMSSYKIFVTQFHGGTLITKPDFDETSFTAYFITLTNLFKF